MTAEAEGPKPATPITCAHNHAFLDKLPFGDRADFEDARRGFIGTLPKVEFRNAEGRVIYSLEDYAFLADEQAPDTVNPSLWRQARLNMSNGLFQVTDRIYQVRGFDISNMTIIEGRPRRHRHRSADLHRDRPCRPRALPAAPRPQAGDGRDLQPQPRRPLRRRARRRRRGGREGRQRRDHRARPLHGGGDEGERAGRHADAPPRHVPVRRPAAQGTARPGRCRARQGHLARHRHADPADAVIKEPIEAHIIDGVEMVFQLAPDTEAPAEMHMFYPGLRALNLAENATHNLHNIYPIRGAQVRDANAWAKYLNEARDRFAREGRRGVRPAPLAGVGQRRACSTTSPSSATPTSTCTTRRCG